MTEDYIRKHFDEVDWEKASKYGEFSYTFMREFADYLDFDAILLRRNLKIDFLREFENKFDFSHLPSSFNVDVIEEYVDYFDEWEWGIISQYAHLTKKFVKKYADKLSWYYIILYQKGIDEKFKVKNLWRCTEEEQRNVKIMLKAGKEKGWNPYK